MGRCEAYKDLGVEWIGDIPKHWDADELREYRRSLISEAVTSKFKVPGV